MKKILCGFTPLALAASAFAEGGSAGAGSTITINGDAASVAGAVTEWAGTLAPTVLGIVGAFLGFWAIKVGIRIIKGIASSSK